MRSWVRSAVASGGLLLVIPTLAAAGKIVIGAHELLPQTATAALGQRVTFVNRSGRSAHVEFHAVPYGHRVFNVPGEIWAVFHVPGRHGYTVHLSRPDLELHGVVEVSEAPAPRQGELRECTGVTVVGQCLER